MLVVDASVAVPACGSAQGFDFLAAEELVAPALMWSEARSALHEGLWRREIAHGEAITALGRLERAPVVRRTHRRLGAETWRIADELGWAKTYDAEYVALASLLECRVLTVDGRLRRGADRLGLVVGPTEL
jgi:indolepyruvate ferredoxin oxidoreductase alpha subunit